MALFEELRSRDVDPAQQSLLIESVLLARRALTGPAA